MLSGKFSAIFLSLLSILFNVMNFELVSLSLHGNSTTSQPSTNSLRLSQDITLHRVQRQSLSAVLSKPWTVTPTDLNARRINGHDTFSPLSVSSASNLVCNVYYGAVQIVCGFVALIFFTFRITRHL